jgi:hypothetical protein
MLSSGLVVACQSLNVRATRTPAREAEVDVGEIALVDLKRRFVLIDLQSNLYIPPPGATLRSKSASGKIARLRVGPEQKRPFVAADIIDGEPETGDLVLR